MNTIKHKIYNSFLNVSSSLIFKKICYRYPEKNFTEHLEIFRRLKDRLEVKYHLIGLLYQDKETREIFLSENELSYFEEAFEALYEAEALESLIKEKRFRIICKPSHFYSVIINSDTLPMLLTNIAYIQKDIKHIKREIELKESMNSNTFTRSYEVAKKDYILISNLMNQQLIHLKTLAIDTTKKSRITASELKKAYRKKAYRKKAHEVHPDRNPKLNDSQFIKTSFFFPF